MIIAFNQLLANKKPSDAQNISKNKREGSVAKVVQAYCSYQTFSSPRLCLHVVFIPKEKVRALKLYYYFVLHLIRKYKPVAVKLQRVFADTVLCVSRGCNVYFFVLIRALVTAERVEFPCEAGNA